MKHAARAAGRYRESARNALFQASNWISSLTVTFAVILICFAAVSITDGILQAASLFLPSIPSAVGILLHPVRFLLLSPLMVGLLYYFTDLYRAVQGEGPSHVPPSVIFSPYASLSSIIRAWGQIFLTALLLALIFVSFLPILRAVSILPAEHVDPYVILLFFCGILLILAVLYLNARLMPAIFLSAMHPELSLLYAIRKTWNASASVSVSAVLLQLQLLTATAVSVLLTAGIVFFLYVFPVSVFTYIGYCHDLSRRCDLL